MGRFVMASLKRAENMPLERIGCRLLYAKSGAPVGFHDGNRIYDLQGGAVGQLHGSHVYCMAGHYVGKLEHGIIIDKNNSYRIIERTRRREESAARRR